MIFAGCQVPDIRDGDAVQSLGKAASEVSSAVSGAVPSAVSGAVQVVTEFAGQAQAAGADVVCFPECYLQGYDVSRAHVAASALSLDSKPFRAVLDQLKHLDAVLVLGFIERDRSEFFNTAAVLHRGRVLGRYRKVHLLRAEAQVFSPGATRGAPPVFDVAGVPFGINICNDLQSANGAAELARAGARVLLAPCNNMLPAAVARAWKDRHTPVRAQRARESGLWVVTSDVFGRRDGGVSFGPTAVINPQGVVVDQVPLEAPGMSILDTAQLGFFHPQFRDAGPQSS